MVVTWWIAFLCSVIYDNNVPLIVPYGAVKLIKHILVIVSSACPISRALVCVLHCAHENPIQSSLDTSNNM